MQFEVLLTPKSSPQKNMETDFELLESLARNEKIILRFYAWDGNCATHGYFIDPFRLLNKDKIQASNLSLARRPTGGGLIFHQYDLAFSFLIPASHPKFSMNTLNNYAFVNAAVAKAIKDFGGEREPVLLKNDTGCSDVHCSQFCMAKSTLYDVIVQNRKVGGAAQRRTKYGLLHQGSIALSLPPGEFLNEMLIQPSIGDAMRQNGYFLLGENPTVNQLNEGRHELQFLLMKAFQNHLKNF